MDPEAVSDVEELGEQEEEEERAFVRPGVPTKPIPKDVEGQTGDA